MYHALPPLAQLRAFAALVEAGTVSAAGVMLNVSHAAISQQVRALEAHLGLALTVKDGRGVRLTEDGLRLGQVLRDSFRAIAHEIDALTGADADRPLQITTTPMFAAAWLMPRLGGFRAAHPDIDLMLNPTANRVPLDPGGIDLAIRFGKGSWPGLEASLLLRTDFIIAGARNLVGVQDGPRALGDLLQYPWLQEIGTTETNDLLRDHGVTEGRVKSMTQLPGNLLLDGLRAGHGVATTARTFVQADLDRGDMVELFADAGRGFGYFLVHRPGPLRPPAKHFARWLRREAQKG